MENSVSQWVYLVTTVLALVALTATHPVVARVGNTTLWTGRQLAVGQIKHIVQTSGIVGETLVEVFNRKPHTYSVLQRLHVVKG